MKSLPYSNEMILQSTIFVPPVHIRKYYYPDGISHGKIGKEVHKDEEK